MTLENQSVDEKLFGLLVGSVKDYAIILIDINGYILSWNKGAAQIEGYTANEAIGQHVSIFYSSGDTQKAELRNNLNYALKHGMYESEGWRRRKNGELFWANVVYTTLYNDNGHLIGFAKIIRDVTERKKLEQKQNEINAELERRVRENTETILANELKFKQLIENSYDGITLFDRELNVLYRSPSAGRINGWANMNDTFLNLLHPDDVEMVKLRYGQLLAVPGSMAKITGRLRHALGHYMWIEAVFTNMLHDDNIKAVVCNFRDITEQVNAQRERERITNDLLKRNKDLEQFAYIISHNLRAPMANIMGLAQIMPALKNNEAEFEQALSALADATQSLDNVVLDLNHILQSGSQMNDTLENINLPLLTGQVKRGLAQMISRYNATINLDFGAVHKLVSIRGYLHSILHNLISNSIKYRKCHIAPVIDVFSRLHGNVVSIHVKDNGKGINLGRYGNDIFGLYKRFDATVEGKGMGLFMVKTQAESLGGTIDVKSEPNKGSEFILSLPLINTKK